MFKAGDRIRAVKSVDTWLIKDKVYTVFTLSDYEGIRIMPDCKCCRTRAGMRIDLFDGREKYFVKVVNPIHDYLIGGHPFNVKDLVI